MLRLAPTSTRAVLVWFALASSVFAQADLYKAVPDGALGVVVVNKLDDLDAKIQAFAAHIKVPAPSPLMSAKAMLGIEKGLNENGSAALVLMPGADSDAEPAHVVLVPVTNYKDFVSQLHAQDTSGKLTKVQVADHEAVIAQKGSYAALTDSEHSDALQALLAAKTSAEASLAPLKSWIASNDVTAIVTTAGIKSVLPRITAGIQDAKQNIPPLGNQETQTIQTFFEMADKIFSTIDKEVSQVALGGKLDSKNNLSFSFRVQFVAGGMLAKLSSGIKPVGDAALAGLPAGPFFIAGGGILPEVFMKTMGDWSIGMMKLNPLFGQLSDEDGKKMRNLMGESIKGVQGVSMVMGIGKPDEPLYGRMVEVIRVADAKGYLARNRKLTAEMGKLFGGKGVPGMPSEYRDVKVGDLDAVEMTMDISTLTQQANAPPGFDQLFEKMFGAGGKMKVYLAAVDTTTVVLAYTSQDVLKEAAQAVRSGQKGLAAQADVLATTALLPKGSQWVGYLSPKGMVDTVQWFVANLPLPVPINIPPFPATSPIGGAATISPAGLQIDVAVPADVSSAISEYVQNFQIPGAAN